MDSEIKFLSAENGELSEVPFFFFRPAVVELVRT